MKKIIALLLSFIICLSLTACVIVPGEEQPQKETTCAKEETSAQVDTTAAATEATEARIKFDAAAAKPLIGTWKRVATFNTADFGLEGIDEEFGIPLSVSFDDAGMYSIFLDAEKFSQTMIAYHTAIAVEEIYADYAAQDLDEAAASEDILNTYGMTVEEYARSSVELTDFTSMLNGTESSGTYALVDGTLYMEIDTDTPVAYSVQVEEKQLTFLSGDKNVVWGSVKLPFPFLLARAE